MLFVSQENKNTINKSFDERFSEFPCSWQEEINEAMNGYNDEEKICMQFLLAFMPDQDVCTYPLSVFEKYVRFALHMREQTPWGKDIQDDIFLNYVLQYRANNEDVQFCLDSFSEELLPRINQLDMEAAVLEVNYWCYEKAVYQSTDMRTISPAAIVKRTYGRCGEESAFCVTALRSVGIPARQVYTPRWAHCNDNHAWVEAYVNGKWRFLGACEPDPVLDSGWFKAPASRAMLIHSKVYSALEGSEHYSVKTKKSLELNLLDHYAEIRQIQLQVLDMDGNPVHNAVVCFKIINYSELSTLNTCRSDADGIVKFTTGAGDLIVHCYHEDLFGFAKISAAVDTNFTVTIGKRNRSNISCLELVPPTGKTFDEIPQNSDIKKQHEARMKAHAEVRENYIKTFFSPEKAQKWAEQMPEYHKEIAGFLESARGNYEEIIRFLKIEEDTLPLSLRVGLLNTLQSKDFVDITCDTLIAFAKHGLQYKEDYPEDVFYNCLLNPCNMFEMITDYRKAIEDIFSTEEKAGFRKSPVSIYDYIQKQIEDSEETRYSIFFSSPVGALKYKKANHLTKRMLFVAICRSLGIPAKIEKKDKSLCYYQNNQWHTVQEYNPDENTAKGCLVLIRDSAALEYMKDFTIGIFRQTDYETLNLRQIPWDGNKLSLTLDEGDYRIITANRRDDGSLLCSFYFVDVLPDSTIEQNISLCQSDEEGVQVQFDELILDSQGSDVPLSSLLTGEKNVLAYLGVGEEPTEHLFNEIIEAKDKISALEIPFIFIVESQNALENSSFKRALTHFSNVRVLVIGNVEDVKAQFQKTKTQDANLPLIAVIDKEKNVHKAWSGYNVGIVSLIIKKLM